MGSHAGEIRHRNISAYCMVHISKELNLFIKMIGSVRINNKMHFHYFFLYSNYSNNELLCQNVQNSMDIK